MKKGIKFGMFMLFVLTLSLLTGCKKEVQAFLVSSGINNNVPSVEPEFNNDLVPSNNISDEKNEFLMVFIDVGQGDSTLVIDGNYTLLVDTGTWDAIDNVEATLSSFNITHLDALLLTHPDYDHIGCSSQIIADYSPDVVYMTDMEKETKSYEALMAALAFTETPTEYLYAGDVIEGGTAEYSVVGPVRGCEYEDVNSYSIVLRITNGNRSYLLTGDGTGEEFADITAAGYDVTADVLKLAHHGSANCGCNNEALLNAIAPTTVIISCGKDNEYGHPHREVRELISKYGYECHRTDLEGNILIR